MRAVLLDQQTFSNKLSFSAISACVSSWQSYATTKESEVVERCRDYEIIITNKVVLSAQILKQLSQLKLICVAATGYNNVDIEAASALGIAVTNVSGYSQSSVSQYVFAQILEYYSQTSHHNHNVETGLWQQSATFCLHGNGSQELAGKKIGIIGYGSLGKRVAQIAKAFDMEVLIAERQGAKTLRANRQDFEQVLKQADIISLHCPQTNDTTAMVDTRFLSLMQPSAMLINTARGPLVKNQDLLNALTNKEIAYAVLDVLEQEPPSPEHILLKQQLPNLKITAHIAWASDESQQRLIDLIAQNIQSFTKGEKLNRIN